MPKANPKKPPAKTRYRLRPGLVRVVQNGLVLTEESLLDLTQEEARLHPGLRGDEPVLVTEEEHAELATRLAAIRKDGDA